MNYLSDWVFHGNETCCLQKMFLKVCTCSKYTKSVDIFYSLISKVENVKWSHSDCEHGNLAHDEIQNES